MPQTDKSIESYVNYFERKWGGSKPFVKLFQTEFGNYLYDPGTNKLLRCNNQVYMAIQQFQIGDTKAAIDRLAFVLKKNLLIKVLQEIVDAIEKEKIMLSNPKKTYFNSPHFSNLENEVNNNLQQIILETTEECNLRCGYCVYNGIVRDQRKHGNKKMKLSTAYKAIDYISAHSSKCETPAITFYGGEPLLSFPFIQKCVEYSHQVLEGKKITFALTTNGTTLTPKISQFLANENFGVTLSIDGPEDVHNDYRLFRNGTKTFELVMKGLKSLVEAYGEKANDLINLSMVYTPPFSSKRLDQIASLWKDYPWLGSINPSITYPHERSIPAERIKTKEDLIEDKSMVQWAMDSYFDSYSRKQQINPLAKSIVEPFLVKLFKRPIFDFPVHRIHLNGCCVPGGRKIHISTDGRITVCERVHLAPPCLGHIDTGIDFNILKRVFVNEYAEKSLGRCANCWANRLCEICYANTFSGGKYDEKRKSDKCDVVVKTVEEQFEFYSRLLYMNPEGLNYLADMEVS